MSPAVPVDVGARGAWSPGAPDGAGMVYRGRGERARPPILQRRRREGSPYATARSFPSLREAMRHKARPGTTPPAPRRHELLVFREIRRP